MGGRDASTANLFPSWNGQRPALAQNTRGWKVIPCLKCYYYYRLVSHRTPPSGHLCRQANRVHRGGDGMLMGPWIQDVLQSTLITNQCCWGKFIFRLEPEKDNMMSRATNGLWIGLNRLNFSYHRISLFYSFRIIIKGRTYSSLAP